MDTETLIRSWLHGRAPTTRANYRRAIDGLCAELSGELPCAQLDDLQAYADGLAGLAPRTQSLHLSAIKSFFAFHVRTGTLDRNPAAALRLPKIATDLAERILTEGEVGRLLARAASQRDYVALRLLYMAGLRASELVGLRWRNVVARGEGGQLTVHGKGGKTRFVLIDAALYAEIYILKDISAKLGDPVFGFSVRTLQNIVKRAAAAAGLDPRVSPHFLRHANASHALDNGCPIHVVQQTLGHASLATTSRYAHARPDQSSGQYLKAQNSSRSAA